MRDSWLMGSGKSQMAFTLLCLTLYKHIKTAQQPTIYSNTVIGTLAVDGWALVASRGLGGLRLRPRLVPSSLYQCTVNDFLNVIHGYGYVDNLLHIGTLCLRLS